MSVIIDILNPEAIVIGSIFERNQDFFVPKIKAVIDREALSCNSSVCQILPAQLGDSIGDYASLGVLFCVNVVQSCVQLKRLLILFERDGLNGGGCRFLFGAGHQHGRERHHHANGENDAKDL